MSWKKFFTPVNTGGALSPISGSMSSSSSTNPSRTNYSSYLPDVYSGHPNRLERYGQYDTMDWDSEVNAALDILAEFCTQENEENGTPFQLFFKDSATGTEVKILKKMLQQWCKINKFDKKMFKIVRNTFKYGDVFFVRDPQNQRWMYVDPAKVDKIIVNESDGKKPEQYVIRDWNPNFEELQATAINPSNVHGGGSQFGGSYGTGQGGAGGSRGMVGAFPTSTNSSRFQTNQNQYTIDARHVIHLSMSEGIDNNYPFGNSLLESVFKVFKQKELLEDAIIIYRVQRAPERRVFYIDVGNMPSHLAMSFVERVKNEVNQRRIPSSTGGSQTVVDSGYNPLCLDLSTKIPLLDGRTLTLQELIEEFNQGKENWTYSCDPTNGKVVPGVINWAGVTRKNAEVIKLTFDNGKELICTPDHKIPVLGRGFVEAKDLTITDSLIALNTRNVNMPNSKNQYQQVWDHASKKWVWTHRMVGEFFRELGKHQEFTYLEENIGKVKAVIHHKDSNRFNNDPRNLTFMNKQDHILYHASQKKEFWDTITKEYKDQLVNKISSTVKENWNNMSDYEKQSALYNIRQAQKRSVWLRNNSEQHKNSYRKNMGAAQRAAMKNNPKLLEQRLKNLENRVSLKNQSLVLTQDMLGIVVDVVKNHTKNRIEAIKICDKNQKLLELVKIHNPINQSIECKIDYDKWGYSKMKRLLTKFGYKNWKDFVKKVDLYNHKIVKIEKVDSRDVGTITIDGKEQWHNFHTFAIDSGIFIKNSINEDYFFPQTAEGRGSKVDILPGGTNLGEIDDLKYFTNKLFRALRIPSSYLPTGPDDGGSNFNDGRVGVAFIQELRFNKYCERLQSMLHEVFDTEFKMYLSVKGINIDYNLFDVKFNPPQNFATYRQAEMDTARVQTFGSLIAVPFLSKRFAMKRFLGLSTEEIAENEKLWKEENVEQDAALPANAELRGAGISANAVSGDLSSMTANTSDLGTEETGETGAISGAAPTEGGTTAPTSPA